MPTSNMSCQKHHGQHNAANRKYLDPKLQEIAKNQSGVGRHKCPYCAYDIGYVNGMNKSDHSKNILSTGALTVKAPTSEFICTVRWLAKNDNGQAHPVGSGVVYSLNKANCLVTANHVAKSCDYDPLIRQEKSWKTAKWKLVGHDTKRDIAVLHCLSAKLLPHTLNPIYGIESTFWGTLGLALGFPQIMNEDSLIFSESKGLPIAIPVPIAANFSSGENADMDGMHYVGGYINAGFSGGAIIFPTLAGWTIAGIITRKASILRHVYQQGQGIDGASKDKNQIIQEHTGLTKFTEIRIAEDIIKNNLPQKT